MELIKPSDVKSISELPDICGDEQELEEGQDGIAAA